jgi:hypothetical protein
VVKRGKDGRWLPGHSPKPGPGRPTGFAGLARKIRDATGDGQELLEIALEIARDKKAKHRDRIAAVQLLCDRGWGKPLQSVELHAAISTTGAALPTADITALPLERQRELLAILDEAKQLAGVSKPEDD